MGRALTLPPEAFAFYLSLGSTRTYAAVGRKYGVTRQSAHARAEAEGWKAKAQAIDAGMIAKANDEVIESLEAMYERHLVAAQVLQDKALKYLLTKVTFESAMDAARALDIGQKAEARIRGEPTDRMAITVEEIIKRESARWLGPRADAAGLEDIDGHANGHNGTNGAN